MTGGLGLLVRSTLRFMRGAPASTLSAFAGVMIGIVSVTGVHLLGERIGDTLDDLRPPWLTGITHILTRDGLSVSDYAALRRQWRSGGLPGVSAMIPLREGTTDEGERVVGTDWIAVIDSGLSGLSIPPLSLEGSNSADAAPVIITGMPQAPGVVFTRGGTPLRVAGRIGTDETRSEPMIHADLSTAFAILEGDPDRLLEGDPDRFDAVLVRQDSGASKWATGLEAFLPGISAGLPRAAMPPIPGWRVHAVDIEMPAQQLARAVLFNLGALGSLSLLVALLLMYQTCTLWMRRQQPVYLVLYELGVSMPMLAASFIAALLLLGIPAIVAGIWLGDLLATVLERVVMGASGGLSKDPPGAAVLIKATAAGLGICLAGGVLAWRQAWRTQTRPSTWIRLSAAALLLAAVVGLSLPALGLAGVFMGIFSVAMLAVSGATPALRGLRRATRAIRGPLWFRLGVREVSWFPDDLSVACAALALAVAVSIGVGVMVDSFRREFADLLDARLSPDLFVTLPTGEDAAALAAEVRTWPEVTALALSGRQMTRISGLPVQLEYGDFDRERALRYGHAEPLRRGSALINEPLAAALGVDRGDVLVVNGRPVTVAGIFKGYGEVGLRMLVGTPTARTLLPPPLMFDRFSLSTGEPERVRARLKSAADLDVEAGAELRASALATFERTFATSDALTWLALFIASVALFNALTGFRLGQQATGRLLDTLGVDGRWMLLTGLIRALLVGGVAMLIALPLGLWLGWVLCHEVNPRAFGWSIGFAPTWPPVLLPLGLAALSALVAALSGAFTRSPWERR